MRLLDGEQHLLRRLLAPAVLQQLVLELLRADADAIDPRLDHRRDALLVEQLRHALEGHLGVGRDGEQLAHRAHHALVVARPQHVGRAAAEVDAVDGLAREVRRIEQELALEILEILRDRGIAGEVLAREQAEATRRRIRLRAKRNM